VTSSSDQTKPSSIKDTPRVNVSIGIILRDGQVLICQRAGSDSFTGLWEFPGGKLRLGELREELGVTIDIIEALAPIEHDYPSVQVRLLPFICRLASGVPRALASAGLQWIAVPRLRDYPFPAANAPLIDQIIERAASHDVNWTKPS
jgi:mutator protein MutT